MCLDDLWCLEPGDHYKVVITEGEKKTSALQNKPLLKTSFML